MVTLSFTSPSSTGGSAITNYAWSVDNGTSWTLRSTASVSSPLQIAGLTNGTTYLIRLRAVNAAGQGAVSDVITAMPVGTSTTPLLTSATPGNRQLSVYFIAPSVATGVRITNYEYTINNGGSWNPLQPASVSSPFTIAGLTNGQTYAVRIRAVTTSGRTAPSNLLQSTPITVPDYPTNIVVTGGNGSATLRFSQPYSNGGAVISNYQYSLNNGAWMDRVPAAPSSPLLITGLTNGLNYSIRIRAVNAAGSGAATWPVTIMPMTAPGMPTGLTGQAFNRSATFSFTAPTANGGVPITHYQWSLDGGQTWSITTLAARSNPSTILDLVNGRTYQVRVRAVNQAGYGPASNIVSVLPCTIPDFPTNIRLEPGNGSATMYFSAPAQTGGAPITNYQFSINNGQTWNNRSPASVSSPITVSGLTNGTRYVIKIRAVNAAGPGLESWGFSVTPRTVPAAPVITAVQPGYGSANLVLQAPANTGGAPVINYEYSLNDGLQWKARTPVHSGSNLFLTGLMNGLTYPVRVRAVNEAGAGATSAMVSVRPRSATIKPTVPGVVEMDSTTSNGGVRVFPNPITSGIINLEMIGAGDFISTIRLLTDDGKVVKINRNQPWKGGKTSLDLSEVRGLSSGLLQWSIEQRIISVRVIWKP
jgi:titin